VVTNGGRVLCATALGNSVAEAQQAAYKLAATVNFKDVYTRSDIAWRAIEREQKI
jgi:phosphoribosylamine--glycine ligase